MNEIIKYSNFERKYENHIGGPIDIFISGSFDVDIMISYLKTLKNEKKDSINDLIKVLSEYEFGSKCSYEEGEESIRVNLKDKATKSFISFSLDKPTKKIKIEYKLDKDIENITNYIDYITIRSNPSEYHKAIDVFMKIKNTIKGRKKI